jgi:integrase
VEALRKLRRRQLEERLAAGERWEDHGLVLATPLGARLDRSEVSRQFGVVQEAAGVAPVVMEALGHSSFGLTMDTYTHVLPSLLREAADAMDRMLGPEELGGQFGGQSAGPE